MLIDTPPSGLPAPETLARELSARLDGFESIDWTVSTGSTNADLLVRARHSTGPMLLGAHHQDAGRGRAGRPWQCRAGATLMFSCALPVRLPSVRLPALSPLAGLAAAEALRRLARPAGEEAEPHQPDALRVKWPNDLQWHDAKLAGILVESARHPTLPQTPTIVIGMGLNMSDAERLSQVLSRPIADWHTVIQHTGAQAVSAADLVCAAVCAWRDAIDELERHGFGHFIERFSRLDALAGREIDVIDRGTVLYRGIADGLDEHGRLMVQTDGRRVPITVGEISIRPRQTEHTP
ncbi:biotin--[acetyl-CoA-carboxylase] ligase [Bordetella sp. 02P26C-1]|uniref:biotin--[acetyl-CoA-carboxylase] ligase n=1 Tax=Bordetella sp. 02P26C-1 TaxID=2683195 RepID=UPI00135354FD|nr:biotin--[acetyl-CoA-carboxylase] ligase [Bordetella sp. 02P26C-1]MVW79400.1 biotin--[acetyl-CoA-carboxylase] ligase [Bordetella sp. 02P26C-1]